MSKYNLVIHPDKRLRKIAKAAENFDQELKEDAEAMFEIMYAKKGIGLAATQIALDKRLIVMDVPLENSEGRIPEEGDPEYKKKKLVLVNPEILELSQETKIHEEGCLSLPNQFAAVERPARVKIKFFNLEGQEETLETGGLLAVCIQHEIDHLNGILFIDHISRLKRERIEAKLAKELKRKNEE